MGDRTNGTQQEMMTVNHVLEGALGRIWSEDDSLRLSRRLDEEIDMVGDFFHFDIEMSDDEYCEVWRRAIYQDLQYLRNNGELGPEWTEDNIYSLVHQVLVLELSRQRIHIDFETIQTTTLSGGSLLEERISKYLKTRSSCDDARDHELICLVCQDQLYQENGTTIATLENCGHEYHVDCIKQWLRRKNLCPLCRAKALPDY
ncbi:hypothetical protein DH2020_019335 [Rehmannia glutinosa]|uniref:RING-type E3 ubiquitin transferase n=1 Tax=Rehmannia glutinosa TaxID=99300 RepID=A0ABR0WLJ5_REHGL